MYLRVQPSLRAAAAAALSRLKRFRAAESGVAAVEFAAVLPVMLIMYLGMVEVGQGISTDRKVTLLARTLADLTSQAASNFNNTEMTNIFDAATTVMAPYSAASAKMVVSSVSIDAAKKATVDWSCQKNGTKRTKGSAVTLPTGLDVANTSLIMAEVHLPYTPMMGYVITGTIDLDETTYMRPRLVATVKDPSC
jgi:Flp pilus assembly protein TadG